MRCLWTMLGLIGFVQFFASAAADGAVDPPVVRIDGGAFLGDLPTIVADSRAMFAEHGLETAIAYSDSGARNMQRLRADEVDFALMALTPLVLDRLADSTPGHVNLENKPIPRSAQLTVLTAASVVELILAVFLVILCLACHTQTHA